MKSTIPHFLKSSVGVVKVKNMFDHFATIEVLAKKEGDIIEIRTLFNDIKTVYTAAHPIILQEWAKHKSAEI